MFVGKRLFCVGFAEHVSIGLAFDERGISKAVFLGQTAVDADEPAVGVLEIDRIRDVIHQRLQEVAVANLAILGAFSLDGIAEGFDEQRPVQFMLQQVILSAQLQSFGGQ